MTRHYYAQYDAFVESHHWLGDFPSFGFANTKEAVAFDTLSEMEKFIDGHSYDLSCHRITRAEAMAMAYKDYDGNLSLPLNDTEERCYSFLIVKWATH